MHLTSEMAVLEENVIEKPRENMETSKKKSKKDNKKVFLAAQELNLARVLAGNNKTMRDRAIKNLSKWFKQRSQTMPYSENGLLPIWKSLFYSMWLSDKPLTQEECAENISKLVHFQTLEESLLFFKVGIQTLCNEWFGIDQLRIDKFLMFTRRLLREALIVLRNNHFSKKSVLAFNDVVMETILSVEKQAPLGLFMHYTEIFMEELSKVSRGKLPVERVADFLKPFIKKLLSTSDGRTVGQIRKFVFTYLIRQSDLGLEYQEKYEAWKREGFPGHIDAMQKIPLENDEKMSSDEEVEDDKEKPLDPRAGRVDVELPQIKFNAKMILNALAELKFDKTSTTKGRKMVSVLEEQFQKLSKGIYPLGVKQIKLAKADEYDTSIKKAVNRLVKFEKKIMNNNDKKNKRKHEDVEEKEAVMNENYEIGTPIRKKQKTVFTEDFLAKAEHIFERNSGIWVVMKENCNEQKLNDSNSDLGNFLEEKLESEEKETSPQQTNSKRKRKKSLELDKFQFSTPLNKKVKINVSLNQTQDLFDHYAQVLNSPAIPYDANKKPTKPMLKANMPSPINPFYNKQKLY